MRIREILLALMILLSVFVIFSVVWSCRCIEVEARIDKKEIWLRVVSKEGPPCFFYLDNGERLRVSYDDYTEYQEGDLFTYRKSLSEIHTPRYDSEFSLRNMSLIGLLALIVLTIFLGLSSIATEIRIKGERGIFLLMDRKAEIGIILLACNIPAYFLVIFVLNYISDYRHNFALLVVFIISGLLLYIMGRNEFLSHPEKNRVMQDISLGFGLVLLIIGVIFSLWWYSATQYEAMKLGIPEGDYFIQHSPSLLFFILWAISGIILLIDRRKIATARNRSD
jgi:hypothetical protein